MAKCTKIKYLTEEAAELRIHQMRRLKQKKVNKRYIGDTDTLTSFKCKYCGYWHIGHNHHLRKING